MSETNENKKNSKQTNNYVKTCRSGAVAANVFARQAPGGFEYLDFSLSRAWKTSNGKEGYSQSFFVNNRAGLHEVIDQACEFIQERRAEGSSIQEDAMPGTAKAASESVPNSPSEGISGEPRRATRAASREARNRPVKSDLADLTNPPLQRENARTEASRESSEA